MVSTDSRVAPSPSLTGTFGVECPLTGLHGAGRWLAETRGARGTWGAGHTRDARRPGGPSLAVPAIPPVAGRTRVTWETRSSWQTFGTSSWGATIPSFSCITFRAPHTESTRGTLHAREAAESHLAWKAILSRGARGAGGSRPSREARGSGVWTLETRSHLSKVLLYDSHANLLDVLIGRCSARGALDPGQARGALLPLHAARAGRASGSFLSGKPPAAFGPPHARLPRVPRRSLWAR